MISLSDAMDKMDETQDEQEEFKSTDLKPVRNKLYIGKSLPFVGRWFYFDDNGYFRLLCETSKCPRHNAMKKMDTEEFCTHGWCDGCSYAEAEERLSRVLKMPIEDVRQSVKDSTPARVTLSSETRGVPVRIEITAESTTVAEDFRDWLSKMAERHGWKGRVELTEIYRTGGKED